MNVMIVRAGVFFASLICVQAALGASLLFTGNDAAGVGRVEIEVDNPETPADIGASDFTLEFWMRTAAGNTQPVGQCDRSAYGWIYGNIIFDRDRLAEDDRDYGIGLGGGRVMFGVERSNSAYTICSSTNVDDGAWHHIAVQRRASDGQLWLHVDGELEAQARGPAGDISYPDGQTSDPREALLVIGREKFDYADTAGYRGWLDEVRLSRTSRYGADNFNVNRSAFALDGNTLALYHFDENAGASVNDENGNQSPGTLRSNSTAGPLWSNETPFVPSSGQIQFSTDTYSATEGGQATVIQVRRVGGTQGVASVSFATPSGTATRDADFQIDLTQLTWADGDASTRTVPFTIVDDTATESNETVTLMLAAVSGATLGTSASTTITILDNDSTTPPPSTPPPSTPPPTPAPSPTPPPSPGGGGGGGGATDCGLLGVVLTVFLFRRRKGALRSA